MKVGDKVLVNIDSGFRRRYEIGEITRETPTQWIVNDKPYHKKDLRLIGKSYGEIEELTPETQARFDEWRDEKLHDRLWWRIRDIDRPYHLTAQRLQEIYDELSAREVLEEKEGEK
jgi:hypothetical protein